MQAVVFDAPGDESVLRVDEVPSPDCGPGEVRIAVAAAGVNRADLLQRRGHYPPPPGASEILGLECAGSVLEVGRDVTGVAAGHRVMALLTGGGYAEQAVAPSGCVIPVPDALSELEAGGLPEVFLTAFLNLFLLGGLEEGATALVHGGSGGVGTAAIQLAKAAGARVVVTAGSDERCRRCLELGAEAAVNHRSQDFVAAARELSDGRGVDVVLDCVGGPYLERHIEALAVGGRLVVIGLQGGGHAELDLARLMRKRLTIVGSTLRARPAAEKAEIIDAFSDRFTEPLAGGRLRPVIDRTFPFEQAATAHRALAGGEVFGKIVLVPGGGAEGQRGQGAEGTRGKGAG
ncbi:MAG: NAD(P)H-quinone oxidoreductase [Thermoanaerobaculales bacterium]|jgi:putative PIG3 family NAD(P)H quinone oxidoreductase|nr:NAD(P)H-quinone oxidoreductase [Thermoanaerobaculales bacterium]